MIVPERGSGLNQVLAELRTKAIVGGKPAFEWICTAKRVLLTIGGLDWYRANGGTGAYRP